jgi:predicted phage terminase large subunit-like protein
MNLDPDDSRRLAIFIKTIRENPYIKQKPTIKQAMFLMNGRLEGLFGGAAGGAKSSGLLMAGLQYVLYPSYSGLLLRRSFKDLSLPGALMDRAHEWLHDTDAKWDDLIKTWKFPSGATLSFGYLEAERDKFRYQGADFTFCGFDELSQFTEPQYLYLFSRLRKSKDNPIPLRMRAASNPGDIGHSWVKERFITYKGTDRFFIPSLYTDNPHLDQKAYEISLNKLDPITRAQLKEGNWDVSFTSGLFKREWFEIVDFIPPGRTVRYWDLAATEQKDYNDPDWTVGCLMSEHAGIFYVKDIVRVRKGPGEIEKIVRKTAEIDGLSVRIYMEREPGSSGVGVIDHYARHILKGFAFYGIRSTGDKVMRAQPLSAAANHHNVKLSRNILDLSTIFTELELFPMRSHNNKHDDIVDAMSGAFNQLAGAMGQQERFLTMISKKMRY